MLQNTIQSLPRSVQSRRSPFWTTVAGAGRTDSFSFGQASRYLATRRGGKVFRRLKSTDNNGVIDQRFVWTKPTSQLPSVGDLLVNTGRELRPNPAHQFSVVVCFENKHERKTK